jgi:hypothetical protein
VAEELGPAAENPAIVASSGCTCSGRGGRFGIATNRFNPVRWTVPGGMMKAQV